MLNTSVLVLALALVPPEPIGEPPVATPAAETTPAEASPTILVVGQRPGPGLWKVSRGDHVLWVFGMHSPLPEKMEWRSHEVESILARSQEYVGPPGVRVGVGFFKGITMLPRLVGVKKNPGDALLSDVLPADVYARWLPLKARYIGDDDDIEEYRPLFAADELMQKAMKRAGLSKGRAVQAEIEKIAKKHSLKMTSATLHIAMEEPARVLKQFKSAAIDDAACFARTIDVLEGDIESMRRQANAWATGDIAALMKLDFAQREDACRSAISGSALAQSEPQLKEMEARAYRGWLAAVEKSLEANASTLTILPLKDLLDPKGPLAALQAKGYVIEVPE